MNHDGTRHGYPNDAYAHLASLLHIPIIASGGAGCAHDIAEVLTVGRADAALAASIFHYGELSINQLKKQLQAENIPVRL
jgi:cyclase